MSGAAWEHGTQYGYDTKGCRCEECRGANAASWRRKAANRAAREAPEQPHGTLNAYNNYGCRCSECRAANAVRSQRVRDAAKSVAS
jgi:hypothetical protein